MRKWKHAAIAFFGAAFLASAFGSATPLGFNCQTQTEGTQCVGRLKSYPEEVAILFPANLKWNEEVLLHFHGWVLGSSEDSTFGAILKNFNFLKRLSQAGWKSGVMVIPSSRGHCDTYQSVFSRPDALSPFLDEVLQSTGLRAKGPKLILSGHSGAYVPMAQVLRQSTSRWTRGLFSVLFFDGTYSSIDASLFSAWLLRDKTHKLQVVFREGTSTQTGAEELWKNISTRPFISDQTQWIPNDQGQIRPAARSGDGADHWGTVRVYLPQFLVSQ